MAITAENFRVGFHSGKTWADADKLVAELTPRRAGKLFRALKVTEAYTGLDMRQEFFMVVLQRRSKEAQ